MLYSYKCTARPSAPCVHTPACRLCLCCQVMPALTYSARTFPAAACLPSQPEEAGTQKWLYCMAYIPELKSQADMSAGRGQVEDEDKTGQLDSHGDSCADTWIQHIVISCDMGAGGGRGQEGEEEEEGEGGEPRVAAGQQAEAHLDAQPRGDHQGPPPPALSPCVQWHLLCCCMCGSHWSGIACCLAIALALCCDGP